MIKRFYIALLFLVPLSIFAQTTDSLTYYFDEEWEICDSSEAVYYRKAIWGPNQKLLVRDYYKKENTIQMEGQFLDKKAQLKTDSFVFYHLEGNISSYGRYVQNEKDGNWISFFDNQKKESEGIYKAGKREGKWIFYHDNGIVASAEVYSGDSLIKMRCWDESGVPQNMCYEEQLAEFPGGESAMMEYLSKSLNYPPILREAGISGRVVIRFNIDKQGNLYKFKVLTSMYEEFSNEAIRVVSEMPKWTPTISHGRLVETSFKLPIVFQLN